MGWRYRKSFKLLPGVRVNVSSRGVSTTIGGKALSVNVGSRGTFLNAGIPGSGFSHRERIDDDASPSPQPLALPSAAERVVIESASTYELASEALAQLQRIFADAHAEQQALDAELAAARPDVATKKTRWEGWNNGFLLKHLMKSTFHRIQSEAEESSARLAELEEQRRLAAVATTIEIADEQKQPFGRLCDAFARLSDCNRIWDTLSISRADQFRERTIAAHSIERSPVRFQLARSPLLVCDWKVPHLANANGGDLFFYPGFVLYQVSRQSFAVMDVREVQVAVRMSRFIEEADLPADTEVVGETWKKANKDGSPDRRFANNYRIPIVKYAEITLTTKQGLHERYMVSNYTAAEQFFRCWTAYVAVFA
jgi:hypothetical protein